MPAERLPTKGMSTHQRQALRAAAMARALRLISIGRLQPRPKSLSSTVPTTTTHQARGQIR